MALSRGVSEERVIARWLNRLPRQYFRLYQDVIREGKTEDEDKDATMTEITHIQSRSHSYRKHSRQTPYMSQYLLDAPILNNPNFGKREKIYQ